MIATPRRLLLIGLSDGERLRFSNALQSAKTTLETCESVSDGLARVRGSSYTTVIVRCPAPDGSLDEVVRAMRYAGAPCFSSGLVVLASPDRLREATHLIGHGVNKVISVLESPDVLACVVMRLESVSSPDGERIPAELTLECGLGGTWRRWRTANLSLRGLLVDTGDEVRVGSAFPFRLTLPGQTRPVEGELKVTRLAAPGRETVCGFGARFVTLAGDGKERLAAFVDEYRTRPRF